MLLSDVKNVCRERRTPSCLWNGANLFRGSLKCSSQQQEAVGGRLTTFAPTAIFVIIRSNKTGNVRMT
jgi:hypothetical protein